MPTPRKPFKWDATRKAYVYGKSERKVSDRTLRRIRDEYIEEQKKWATNLSSNLANGQITLRKFEKEFQARIKKAHTAEFMLGRGGKNAMTKADKDRLALALDRQYNYLRGFTNDITNTAMSEAAISSRAQLYFESSRAMYEQAKAEAWGIRGELPGFPGQDVQCGPNCRCSWSITETTKEIRATWILSSGNSCPDCQGRAGDWAPFVIVKTETAS